MRRELHKYFWVKLTLERNQGERNWFHDKGSGNHYKIKKPSKNRLLTTYLYCMATAVKSRSKSRVQRIQKKSSPRSKNPSAFFGKAKGATDALTLQKKMRNEWT